MAPPDFPQGMTLHSIGYAALKYPELPEECPVPLNNQLGVLQRFPPTERSHAIDQISSQYLDTFLEYLTSDDPLLHDRSSSQYYFPAVGVLLSWLMASPDVATRVAKYRNNGTSIAHEIVEKMLDPDFEKNMKAADRSSPPPFPPNSFDADFGTLLQFLSTIILWSDEPVHPRVKELIPKLKTWKKTYKNSPARTISNASDRLVDQIGGTQSELGELVKKQQKTHFICGSRGCRKQDDLTACGACKIQRYCGKDHQKADWKYHKHICKKGLVEGEE